MKRLRLIAVLGVIAAVLWWYRGVAASYGMFGGSLAFALDVAASVATAAALVLLIAELVIGYGIAVLVGVEPTGFLLAGTYAVLVLAALAVVLGHFGVNVTTVVATSAVLTAVIGLALQPTLGAFIAGLALHADRVLRIGDGLVIGEVHLVVVSVGWRSVIGAKADGTRVVLSNAKVLDGVVEIVPSGAPVRAETEIVVPLGIEPGRVGDLVAGVLADFSLVDARHPISVAPIGLDPEKAQTRYRIRCWVRGFGDREPAIELLLERLWYLFQREGIAWSGAAGPGEEPTGAAWAPLLATAVAQARREDGTPAALSGLLAAAGTLLLYAEGERIVIPDRLAGRRCLLVRGQLHAGVSDLAEARGPIHGPIHGQALGAATDASRRMALVDMSARLAAHVGPFAELAVRRAARAHADLGRVRAAVAVEIDDEEAREAFLAMGESSPVARWGPGFLFVPRLGATGQLQPDPPLCAAERAALVAIQETPVATVEAARR